MGRREPAGKSGLRPQLSALRRPDRHRHHHELRRDDAGRHQGRPEFAVVQRELLPDQRQHGGIGEVEHEGAAAKTSSGLQVSSACKPDGGSWPVLSVHASRPARAPDVVDRIRRDAASRRRSRPPWRPSARTRRSARTSRPRRPRTSRRGVAGMVERLVTADARANAFGPTMPSVIAAIAGAKIEPAAPVSDCVRATSGKAGRGSDKRARVTTTAAAMTITPRLAEVLSISAPAGVCARMPATPATDITMPMRPRSSAAR